MKIVEHEAKAVLRTRGLSVPSGQVASSPEAACACAASIGLPVVIKAQIPLGGRMKAGGILFANTENEVYQHAESLLGTFLRGHQVEELLIEKRLTIRREVFASITFDPHTRRATFIASRSGGIDIEAAPDIVRRPLSLLNPPSDFLGREIAESIGVGGKELLRLGALFNQLIACFQKFDAELLELNPIILDDNGTWWIADVHLELDDDALYRQGNLLSECPTSVRLSDRRTDFERQAAAIDKADHRGVAGRLIPFDGSLGMLIGGGGASLTTMDAALDVGLKPANYCEIGGNPSVWKIKELTKLILSQPGVDRVAVIMNVVSNTRVDLIARGVIKGILELGLEPQKTIAVFRVPGSWEEEGAAIMRYFAIPYFGRETSIDQAVEAIQANGNSG